ncbi:hypothetical protein BGCPKDLD_4045 [Methylorubrum suomiense]|uniref:Uncharacterized protein n=2 Tax=Methylobacteriaceae TaxID=119045 RepID=A0ABQ4UYN1_9HYPH|nr:hypothetical protein BGCPKDLD_4045 [Methylorubrum suomiense]
MGAPPLVRIGSTEDAMTFGKTMFGAAALFAAFAGTVALAQDPSVPQRGQDSDPKLPAPNDRVPEKVRPEGDTTGTTLSDKLEKSDGVIKPPAGVDPEIRTIAPDPTPNSTPVIKPPGNAK